MKFTKQLVVVLCLILLMAACSDKKSENSPTATPTPATTTGNTANNQSQETKDVVNPPGVFPIVDEKITLRIMVKGDPRIEDYNTNEFTRMVEEKTNIHIEWIVAHETEYTQQLNLAIASGNFPDVFLNMGISPEMQVQYGDQGIFVSLTDYIEKYGDRLKAIYAEAPEIRNAMTAPGGKIYSLPNVNDCLHCSVNARMHLYQPWMDALNLTTPTTTEEFREVLKAFVTQDPNGNGKKDEIGLMGATAPLGSMAMVDIYLMNAFIYNDGEKRLFVKNGKIEPAYNKPEWKEGLKYLHSLYKDGLLAEQSFSQERPVLRTTAENPGVAVVGAIPGASVGSITSALDPSNRWKEYQPIPPLKGPNGVQLAVANPYFKIGQGGFVVTSANKYPEATVRMADFILELENQKILAYGKKGEGWVEAAPGETGRTGEPATWKALRGWPAMGTTINYGWIESGVKYWPEKDYNSTRALTNDDAGDYDRMLYNQTIELYQPYALSANEIVPPLFFDSEKSQRAAELQTTISNYVTQMIARFSLGNEDIDSGWDKYVQALEDMGLQEYLAIYQEAYDAVK